METNRIHQLHEFASIEPKDRCKTHTIHGVSGDVVKIHICEEIDFYSNTYKPIQYDSDLKTLEVFLESIVVDFSSSVSAIKERINYYRTSKIDYGNEAILKLFEFDRTAKDLLKYASELHIELEKINNHVKSDVIIDLILDSEEVVDDIKLYCEMLSDNINLISTLNNNDTNNLMKKLTTLTVIFTPLNLLAGMGGMSEWSAFVTFLGVHAALGYSLFALGLAITGFVTWKILTKI